MKVIQKGEGEPELAVVGSIHGDEPCGKKAIEKFLESDHKVKKPVKFVIANEEALEENERFLDVDLNRSFPGNSESDLHEEKLAAEILEEVEGMKVMDLHATRSEPTPFLTLADINENVVEMVKASGVETACYFEEESGVLGEYVDGFIVESGPQGSEESVEMTYRIMLNYLAAMGVIEGEFEKSDPNILKYYETVRGGDWNFLGTNFEKVEKGEVFAKKGTTELVTTEGFYPVLMSDNGYENILGHKARKLGKASELVQDGS